MKSKGLQVPTTPEDVAYITLPLTIPDTPEWRGVFCGLLYSISFGYWWDKNSGDWETAKQIGYSVAFEACKSMGICDEVADCIEGSETIREIIREIIKETVISPDGGGSGGRLGVGIESLENCDEDYVFGAVTGLVNYQLQAVRDALELIEVATNGVEVVLGWVGNFGLAIPILSIVADYISWIQDSIAENFEAQVTTALIDEYRCDLFCLYLENCDGLTAEQIAGYFLGRIGGESFVDTLEDLLSFFITGEFTGSQIVDAMMAGSIAMMTVNLDWIPFITIPNLYSIDLVFSLSADNPDSDWTILCPNCTGITCYRMDDMTNITVLLGSVDPLQGNPEPSILGASGVNSGTYPLNGAGTSSGIAPAIRIDFDAPLSVQSVKFDYLMDATGTDALLRGFELREFGTDNLLERVVTTVDDNDGNWWTWTRTVSESNVGALVVWISKTSNPTTTGTSLIDNVCIQVT